MSETAEFQPWMESPWVMTIDDIDSQTIEDIINLDKVAWFDVNMDLSETDQEKKEKIQAQKEQIEWGILQPNGYPVGMAVPHGANINPNFNSFNFPGAIGIPLPSKFNPTPVTRHLQSNANALPTKLPKSIPGILPSLSIPQKAQDRKNAIQIGDERLRRIQELTKDRRK